MKNGVEDVEYKYIYDKLGNNTEITTKYKTSDFGRTELQYFDKNHRIIKSINLGSDNERLDSTEYGYDENGNLTHLNWMGGLNTKSIYKYDSDGNEVEYSSVAFDNQISDHRVMTYQNKLVQTRIHYDGKKIKYYFAFDYEFY